MYDAAVQVTCLQFCGNRIVSGSDDNTLKVWNAITGKVRGEGEWHEEKGEWRENGGS